jgi:23S rRNA (adenine2503-C2)-methyltransferase
MHERPNIFGYTRPALEDLMVSRGVEQFRGRQLFKWIYHDRVFDFHAMTDLKKDFRSRLENEFRIEPPQLADRQSSKDGTEKFLFVLDDGNVIESVLIPDQDSGRMTLCISSQSGCALGCAFCATGYFGFKRNLSIGEIVGQLIAVRKLYGEEAFENIVFMGMGEPLLNYDAVMAAVDIIIASDGLMVGARRITVSTSGIIREIYKLADSNSKVNLALSLHAANNDLRKRLMPVARGNPLEELMEAVRYWATRRARRVTFEYILFKGINDSDEHALELARLIQGIPCKINVMAYNPVDGADLERPADEAVDRFARFLYPRAPAVTVRKSRGVDIDAACGQLAAKRRIAV